MRYIRKRPAPVQFRQWLQKNEGLSPTFKTISADAKKALREQMLDEQGYLCAYTMWPLRERTRGHIEHIRAQSRYPELALEYDNMLMCVTATGSSDSPFGANQKADADVDDGNFVSPLRHYCETRFRFRRDGEVVVARRGDEAAASTIKLLHLNHPELRAARGRAIAEQLSGPGKDTWLTSAQARRLAADVLLPDKRGKLAPFCVAVHQAAAEFAGRSGKVGRRLAARQAR